MLAIKKTQKDKKDAKAKKEEADARVNLLVIKTEEANHPPQLYSLSDKLMLSDQLAILSNFLAV